MRTMILSLLLAASACRGAPSQSSAVSFASGCLVPGAAPDDGVDDTAAIQAAFASGCAALAVGTYDVVTPPAPDGGRRSYAMLDLAHAELYGAGADTVLRFSGDAGGAQDWYGIALGSSGSLHDLTLDTSGMTGTVEQTHAVRVTGPAAGGLIARVTFVHPQRGMPGGDCVQVVGYSPDRLVTGLRIVDSTFRRCDRSGIAIHSGVRGIAITGDSFADTGDQDIDGEGSGDIDGVLIDHCTFGLGQAPQGDLAIQLEDTAHAVISNSSTAGRGIQLYGCSGCELDHVTIARTVLGSPRAALDITKDSAGVVVRDSAVTRASTAMAGPVVRLSPHGAGAPSAVRIEGAILEQHTPASVLLSVGVVGLAISGATIAYSATSGANYGVDLTGSVDTRTTGLEVSSTAFTGPLAAAVRISGSYAGAGSLACTGNVGNGPARGLRCERVAEITGPVTSTGNSWAADQCGAL